MAYDSCKNCSLRDNFDECKRQACSVRNSWYAITLETKLSEKEKEVERLREAVRAVRYSDCGGWMKDCTSQFTCGEGKPKRIELMKCLDKLYKVALEGKE